MTQPRPQATIAVAAPDLMSLAALVLEDVNRATQQNVDAFLQRLQALERGKSTLQALIDRFSDESEELARELNKLYDELFVSSELDEQESLRLQMAMDRMSKMMSTLSNILKKVSDTDQSIVQNLK